MPLLSLIKRKEYYLPTLRGWLLLLVVLVGLLVAIVRGLYWFLAPTAPTDAEILVVEGWLPDKAIEQAANEFRSHKYRLLVTTGGPLREGSFLSPYKSYAELTAASFRQLGIQAGQIVAVPAPAVREDRTYASAVALRRWMGTSGDGARSLNLYSLGAHARRSRLMFKKALGSDIIVGVIAVEDTDYDPRSWWTSSSGVRDVLDEAIGYAYAVLLFHPTED